MFATCDIKGKFDIKINYKASMCKGEKQTLGAMKWWSMQNYEYVGGSAYQNYFWCNVNDFSLSNIISIITCIYLHTLAMIPHMKEPNLPNFSPNSLRDDLDKLH